MVVYTILFGYCGWATAYEVEHHSMSLAALTGACTLVSLMWLVREVVR